MNHTAQRRGAYHPRMFPHGRPLPYSFNPLEALRRWPAQRPVVMLHSGRFDAQWSRYSLLAEPVGAMVHRDRQSAWIGEGPSQPAPLKHDPFGDLDAALTRDASLYVGHLGYELAHAIEALPHNAAADHGWPDMQFQRCPNFLVYDHSDETWQAVGPNPESLPDLSSSSIAPDALAFESSQPRPDLARADHEAAVQRGLEYIAAGDVFQVNLAQRFTAEFEGSTRGVFLQLAQASPAWYGAYLELLEPDGHPPRRVACSTSPELFLQLDDDGRVTTRPIKGTRPADVDPNELRDAEKDTAELNMIIDLLRNDLGRVCDYGSVRVTQPRTVESHPTVHHGVATVTGQLHESRSLRHLLRATFPGGSITGAPKVRAMQIIDELEPVARGPYCGAIGYAQQKQDRPTARLNIAIRTLLIDREAKRLHFSVGGGIVADSDPAEEYDETLHKAQAMLQALKKPPTPQASQPR
ncbi:anthranilate synthase component I family protein [Algisphaera agarilytica]|uniref:Para-aminobenzoate synthetase component 1 n=1 Tax=Algisphaera agarilytica TaxID=1385975 RepID=A0A7X0H889_9BACT|nr:anthranilate synthase component I family protein [Algisphaera agarilytica]MBB6430867.1 para-aminobenzoate synthetase component 1 [Algisphaera agarilytica]